jgi:hypothetical protein
MSLVPTAVQLQDDQPLVICALYCGMYVPAQMPTLRAQQTADLDNASEILGAPLPSQQMN